MVDFGYSLIVDPGGNELLRRAANCDVESHSRLVVNPGEGCYILINGEAAYIDEPGRYEIGTGLSPYFKPIQVLISKGISTYTSIMICCLRCSRRTLRRLNLINRRWMRQ